MIFKYADLQSLLEKMNSLGEFQLFKDWKGEKVYLLRHDVDFDLQLALDLAILENKLGIKATYFILTTCHTYNILSEKNRERIINIADLGHEIALHFDPTLYTGNLNEAVKKEAEILEFVSKQKVKSISLHNPSIHGTYPEFDGFINAYNTSYFSDENYISDSRFDFRGKNPFEFIGLIKDRMIQVNLHPFHYSKKGSAYDEIFKQSFNQYLQFVHDEFSNVNNTYLKQVPLGFEVKIK